MSRSIKKGEERRREREKEVESWEGRESSGGGDARRRRPWWSLSVVSRVILKEGQGHLWSGSWGWRENETGRRSIGKRG